MCSYAYGIILRKFSLSVLNPLVFCAVFTVISIFNELPVKRSVLAVGWWAVMGVQGVLAGRERRRGYL